MPRVPFQVETKFIELLRAPIPKLLQERGYIEEVQHTITGQIHSARI